MEKWYLYRLYFHSKSAFSFVLLYIFIYAMLLFKNMDMSFFPHNSMFRDANKGKFHVLAVKVNNDLLPITHNLYWKKDFLETSLQEYVHFSNGKSLPTSLLIHKWKLDDFGNSFFFNKLIPSATSVYHWPEWYVQFAGKQLFGSELIEVWQYSFLQEHGNFVILDSSIVLSSKKS